MSQDGVLRELETDEQEGYAKAGEDGAQGHESPLGTAAGALAILGATEELHECRYVGQGGLRAIAGQDAMLVLPEHTLLELFPVSLLQTIPERSPETQRQQPSCRAKSLFGHTGVLQGRTDRSYEAPGLGQSLGHRLVGKADIHHQPGDYFRTQRTFASRFTATLPSRDGELFRGQEGPEGRQTEVLQNVCSTWTT